jgi:hypothetical protein
MQAIRHAATTADDGANEGGFLSAYPNGNRGRHGPPETLADSHPRAAAGSCYGTQRPVKTSVEKIASSPIETIGHARRQKNESRPAISQKIGNAVVA